MQTPTADAAPLASLADILKHDLGVKESYRHTPKWVTPGDPLETEGAILKWYALAPKDEPVPEEIDRLAHDYLARHSLEAKGLGFVILHRCGSDFYFLIVNTWRGNNEVWETVFYKDGAAMADFAPSRARGCTSRPSASGNSPRSGTRKKRGSDFLSQRGMTLPRRLGWAIAMPETHE